MSEVELLLHPRILSPLLGVGALAVIVGASPAGRLRLILLSLLAPLGAALWAVGPHELFAATGETHGWALGLFIFIALVAFAVFGASVWLGRLVRRFYGPRTIWQIQLAALIATLPLWCALWLWTRHLEREEAPWQEEISEPNHR